MLGPMELTLAALVVAVVALVLRLRQSEPAAVERLGLRLDAAPDELAAAEERVLTLRTAIDEHEAALGPLQDQRVALEQDVDAARAAARQAQEELGVARAELEAANRSLAEQRALRAETEAALRTARQGLAAVERGERPDAPVRRDPRAGQGATARMRAGTIDLDAVVASTVDEPPLVRTDGAVRPSEALPPEVLEGKRDT
jgi:septal ring factor EnvC (AmiA/AmiB activator)